MSDWEERAVAVATELEELQADAPIDVSGYLKEADAAVNHALAKYRQNRSDADG